MLMVNIINKKGKIKKAQLASKKALQKLNVFHTKDI